MIHLGDITKIKGNEAPTVDCVIGGSPCQDLSLAGKRAGLAGARSGLYMEQIRIIKEMREADVQHGRSDVDVRPRYMVWENVPGAFSTNQGQDFAAVLEEAIRVAEPEAPSVSVPEKGWPTAGCIVGECWSIAWRVLDAQYWGVPQRRRRICLVCDFNGLNAPKIVFGEAEHHGGSQRDSGVTSVGNIGGKSRSQVRSLSQGVSGNLDESQQKGEEAAGDAGVGFGGEGKRCVAFDGSNITSPLNKTNPQPGDPCHTLHNDSRNYVVVSKAVGFPLGFRPENVRCYDETATTLCNGTRPGFTTGVIQEKTVIAVDQGGGKSGAHSYEGVSPTLTCTHGGEPAVAYAIDQQGGKGGANYAENVMPTLCSDSHGTPHAVAYSFGTLQAKPNGGQSLNYSGAVRVRHIVRRLTPLECERLQGFPDGWTLIGEPVEEEVADYDYIYDESKYVAPKPEDYELTDDDIRAYFATDEEDIWDERILAFHEDLLKAREKAVKRVNVGSHKEINYYYTDSNGKRKKVSDSARYRALGNSIALPPWKWTLKRLCACYERDATMASLFDGIGGFPLIWEQLNGKGSCIWASEIDEFPMAVTKLRFGGNDG